MSTTLKKSMDTALITKELNAIFNNSRYDMTSIISQEIAWRGYCVLEDKGKAKYLIVRLNSREEDEGQE